MTRGCGCATSRPGTGVTERTAYGIVTDLTPTGSVAKHEDGHRNRSQIKAHLPLPGTDSRERAIGEILALLAGAGQDARAGDLLREHLASVRCDPLAIRITARPQPPTGPGDDFEDLASQLPGCHVTRSPALHDALTRAARVVMAFKYGAAAHSGRDYPLIHAGGRSGKVRVLRSGHGL